MEFICEPALQKYMQEKQRYSILVEVISSNSSDFEVTELYTRLVTEKQADFYEKEKKYRRRKTDWGEVLLPSYKLEYGEVITFSLHSFWIFKSVKQKGIEL